MKTNLDKEYKNNEKEEKEGIWFDIKEGVGFLVRRFGGYNSPKMKAAIAQHLKPYSYQIQKETLDHKKEIEIYTKLFVDSCVVDWKGIEIDGKIEEFSKDRCTELLIARQELLKDLIKYSEDSKNYREELGNS